MLSKSVLALSSSREGNSGFLQPYLSLIDRFFNRSQTNIAFISFASVDNNAEKYTDMVRQVLQSLDLKIHAVSPENAKEVIEKCDAVMVGGGNTFKLIHDLYQLDLIDLLRSKVNDGVPYVGWSAGSNILGLTIGTTNDMPIIQPESFTALGVFPFQINPHYVNVKAKNFNGETRDQRLEEFVKLNPDIPVVCLPEGASLLLQNDKLKYTGRKPAILFEKKAGESRILRNEIAEENYLSFLL